MTIQNRHYLQKINGIGHRRQQLDEQAGSLFPQGQLARVLGEQGSRRRNGRGQQQGLPPNGARPNGARPNGAARGGLPGSQIGSVRPGSISAAKPNGQSVWQQRLEDVLADWDNNPNAMQDLLDLLDNWPQNESFKRRLGNCLCEQSPFSPSGAGVGAARKPKLGVSGIGGVQTDDPDAWWTKIQDQFTNANGDINWELLLEFVMASWGMPQPGGGVWDIDDLLWLLQWYGGDTFPPQPPGDNTSSDNT